MTGGTYGMEFEIFHIAQSAPGVWRARMAGQQGKAGQTQSIPGQEGAAPALASPC